MKENRRQIKLFWDREKRHLKARKVSQREFAHHIGVSRRTLEGWIFQNRLPNVFAGSRIAMALGLSTEELLWGREDAAFDRQLEEARARKEATKAMDKLIFQLALRNSRLHGAVPLKYTGIWGIPAFTETTELKEVWEKTPVV